MKEKDQTMRQHQLASQGRLLADFSHEMRNHLAVIQEANGLLEDVLAMEEGKGNSGRALLDKGTAQVAQRVRAAGALCQHLSSMAHRSDTPRSFFQVNELVTELAALLERSARSQQVSLELQLGQESEPIYNEPALLHYILHKLYLFSLSVMGSGKKMIISTAHVAKRVHIRFYLSGVPQLDLSLFPRTVLEAIASIGAELKDRKAEETKMIYDDNKEVILLELTIPSLPLVS